jgi:SAM-dependent methyltransferase
MAERANYGINAPGEVRRVLVAALLLASASLIFRLSAGSEWPRLASGIVTVTTATSLSLFAGIALMAWGSTVGRLRQREKLLDSLTWRGSERVLDAGCGRGLLLNAAARRLTDGIAVGVDLWRSKDQSGNRPSAALANSRAEGVDRRVRIVTGDVRDPPFAADSFDIVMSSLVIHNIPDSSGRRQAVEGMVRVLRPGGQLLLLDIFHTKDYVEVLGSCGMADVQRRSASFRFAPGPRVVVASKPRSLGELDAPFGLGAPL